MNKAKTWIVALLFVVFTGGTLLTIAAPQTAVAASKSCVQGFLTFPAWYRGLNVSDSDCSLKTPNDFDTSAGKNDGLSNYIWIIVLNCIDIGLNLVGYVSAFFIIYGGFMFLTAGGEAALIAKGKTAITNAVIGLVISIAAITLVNVIVGIIK